MKKKLKIKAQKREAAPPVSIEVLKSGKTGEFWRIICAAIDANIAELDSDLKGPDLMVLSANEYKIRSEIIKAKIIHLANLKETPDNIISAIADEAETEGDPDPYEK